MAKGDPQFQIVCELFGVEVSWQQAKIFEDALTAAAAEAFPGERVRGLWVHRGVPKKDSDVKDSS